MAKEKNDFELMIDDNFKIVFQQDNFVLQEYGEVKTKGSDEVRQEWKFQGYFGSNLSGALRRYIALNISRQENTSTEHLIETIKEAEKRIEDVVAKNKLKLKTQLEMMKT
jgi:hypothetical protein